MAGFFDYIPIIAIILFAAGIVGVMVYWASLEQKILKNPPPKKFFLKKNFTH